MRKTLTGLLVLAIVSSLAVVAQAGDTANVTVRVTITSVLDITLVSGSLIDFGSMAPGASASVSSTSTTIKNNSSGINQTYKMSASGPGSWTSGSSVGNNTYVLKAAFHSSQPSDFDSNTNTLDAERTASNSVLTIDGSSTGASVLYGEERTIWYEFQPPSTSSLTGVQDIAVTIIAIAG